MMVSKVSGGPQESPDLQPRAPEPLSLLGPFLQRLPEGPVLDLGPDAVNRCLPARAVWSERCPDDDFPLYMAVDFHPVDVVEFLMSYGHHPVLDALGPQPVMQATRPGVGYALVLADDLLSSLPPEMGERAVERIRILIRPGGIAFATALAVADPSYAALQQARRAVARHTYATGEGEDVVRYFAGGELAMAFHGWGILHSTSVAYAAPEAEAGYRVMDFVVARRPVTGTDLA